MEGIHVPSLYRVIAKMRYCFSPGRNLVSGMIQVPSWTWIRVIIWIRYMYSADTR